MGKCSPESEGLVVQGLLYRLCMGKKLLLENVTLFTVCSMYDHCKKNLGYFNHTFRLSQLHQCGQEMLSNRFS